MEKIKLLIRGFGSVLFFSALLFICAGKIDYTQGWMYFLTGVTTTLITFFVTGQNSELLKERANAGQGAAWDKTLLGLSAIVFLVSIIIAGLDTGRFAWSPEFPLACNFFGMLLTIGGHGIFLTAQKQNNFFSAVYRIQTDRGHVVCDTGIYKLVRHPGYLGMSISLLGFPLLTGSLWTWAPILVAIVLLLVRTHLEDQALCKDLNGYLAYTKRTPYKLIPYVW